MPNPTQFEVQLLLLLFSFPKSCYRRNPGYFIRVLFSRPHPIPAPVQLRILDLEGDDLDLLSLDVAEASQLYGILLV